MASARGSEHEVLVPFPTDLAAAPVAKACRSTILLVSMQVIKDLGRWEDYTRVIDKRALEEMLSAVAGLWLPIEVAVAHYRACDALGFSSTAPLASGGQVLARLQQSFIGTVIRGVRESGTVTPWTGLGKFHHFYSASFQGGGSRVSRIGPKDARIEVVGLPLAAVPYFRTAYRGYIRAAADLFSVQSYCNEIPALCSSTTVGFRLAWS